MLQKLERNAGQVMISIGSTLKTTRYRSGNILLPRGFAAHGKLNLMTEEGKRSQDQSEGSLSDSNIKQVLPRPPCPQVSRPCAPNSAPDAV